MEVDGDAVERKCEELFLTSFKDTLYLQNDQTNIRSKAW